MSESSEPAIDAFFAALDSRVRSRLDTAPGRDAVRSGLAAAATRWTDSPLGDLDFARLAGQSVDAWVGDGRDLEQIHWADLHLACAADPEAPAAARDWSAARFESEYSEHIAAIVARISQERALVSEARQSLHARLFVAQGSSPPKIRGYAGKGPLLAFVRVAAMRTALGLLRSQGRRREDDDDVLLGTVADDADPELAYFKLLYRQQLRQAFADALAALSKRERSVLRFKLVDGLSIDQIASIYGVHRSTAARQLNRAQQQLVESTRQQLRTTLAVNDDELQSIMRLVESSADVSVRRLLGSDDPG